MKIAAKTITLSLGGFVNIRDTDGFDLDLQITPAGVAAKLTGSVNPGMIALPSPLKLTATSFSLLINTATTAIGDVPAGPLVRFEVLGATLAIDQTAISFGGDFTFEQSTRAGFGTGVTFTPAAATTQAIATGDVDGDGDLDVVVGNNGANQLFINSPTATASAGNLVLAATGMPANAEDTRALALADVNHDGFLDLIVVNAGTTRVHLNKGLDHGVWQGFDSTAKTTFATPDARGLTVGDVDADGNADLVLASDGPAGVQVELGNGDGTFNPGTTLTVTAIAVTLGDVSGDGAPDLVVVGHDGTARLYKNTAGAFSASTDLGLTNVTTALLADLDGDGSIDGLFGTNAGVKLLTNDTHGVLGAAQTLGAGAITALAVGDVDGDGYADIVAAVDGSRSLLLVNKGAAGGFRDALAIGDDPLAAPHNTALAVANLDTDHDVDVLIGVSGAASRLVLNDQVQLTRLGFANVTVTLTATSGGSGVTIDKGTGGFVIVGGSDGGFAGQFSGTVHANSGAFSGNASIAVRINTTKQTFDETIDVGGTAVDVKFAGSEIATGTGTTFKPFVTFSGSGLIKIGGVVEVAADKLTSAGDSQFGTVNVFIGQGPGFLDDTGTTINPNARGILLKNAIFEARTLAGGGFVIYAKGTLKLLGIPGLDATEIDVEFKYNTTGGDVTLTHVPGQASVLVEKDTTEVAGTLDLRFSGVSLHGAFTFKQTTGTTAKPGDLSIHITDGTLSLGDGGAVSLTKINGDLTSTAAGLVAGLSTSLTLNVPGIDPITVDLLSVDVNTTNDTVDGRAPHSLVVHADGLHLNVLGQQLSGNFTFEQVTTPAVAPATGSRIVRVGASDVHLFVGDEAGGAGVSIDGANALFVIRPAGIAGSVTDGTINVLVPGGGVTFTGTFSVALNTTNQAVSEQLVVGGQTISLILPSGPFLRVAGDNIVLAFAGQRITGSFAFESAKVGADTVTRVFVTGVSAAFGDGTNNFVTMSGGSGFFLLRPEGMAGSLGGTVAVTIPGVALTGTFKLEINTATATDPIDTTITFGPAPGTVNTVALGDLNGDGKPDLVAGTNANGILIAFNDGSGSPFDSLAAVRVASADDITSIALGDVDEDGDLDLVTGQASGAARLYRNDGHGAFGPATDLGDGRAVALADLNHDGHLDLVLGGSSGATWTAGDGTGAFTGTATAIGPAGAVNAVAIGDFNHDGRPDVAIAGATVDVYVNSVDTPGTFAATAVSTSGANTLAIADTDGDGREDVIADTTLFRNLFDPGHPDPDAVPPSLSFDTGTAFAPLSATTTGAALADLDGDGALDLVQSNGAGDTLTHLGSADGFGDGNVLGKVTVHVDGGQHLRLNVTDMALTVAGQTLTGSLEVARQTLADGTQLVTVHVPHAQLVLADGQFTFDVDGDLQIGAGGLAGRLHVSTPGIALGGGMTLTGSFTLSINTGAAPVLLSDGVTRLPAGQFLRVEASVSLTIPNTDAVLAGNVALEQATSSTGVKRLVLAFSGLRVTFGGSDVLTGGQGVIAVLPTGIAGQLSGTITLSQLTQGAVTITGTLGLTINQTLAGVNESITVDGQTLALNLPAGRFLRISGTNLTLAVAGQTLSGDYGFERQGTTTVLTMSNVSISLGGVVNVTHGSGIFTIAPSGLTGHLAADVAVSVPGVTLTGTGLGLDLAPGSLKVGGTGALTIAGQSLSGTFFFTRSATTTQLTFSGAHLFLGDPSPGGFGLDVTQKAGDAIFTITPQGVTGSLTATFALSGLDTTAFSLPPVDVTLAISPTTLRVELSTGAQKMSIFGQQFGGTFSFERVIGAGPDKLLKTSDDTSVIRVAMTGVTLFLGSAPVGLDIRNGTGRFLITKAGVAGDFSALASLNLGGGVAVNDVSVAFAFNNIATAVDESFSAGGQTTRLQLPAGPYLRASLTGLSLNIGGQTLTADVAVEKLNVSGSPVTRIAFANVGLRVGSAGRDFVVVSGGTGTVEIATTGVFGSISANVAVDIPNVSLTGAFTVGFDTRGAKPSVSVTGTNLVLNVLGQKLTGGFTFTKDASGNVLLTVSNVKLELGNGTTTLVTVTLASGAILLRNDGMVVQITDAAVAFAPTLTDDFSFAGTMSFSLNTTKADVTLPGGAVVTPGLKVSAGDTVPVDFRAFGQSLQRPVLLRAVHDRQGHEGRQDQLQPRLAVRRRPGGRPRRACQRGRRRSC